MRSERFAVELNDFRRNDIKALMMRAPFASAAKRSSRDGIGTVK
jgi:hypothetical protein